MVLRRFKNSVLTKFFNYSIIYGIRFLNLFIISAVAEAEGCGLWTIRLGTWDLGTIFYRFLMISSVQHHSMTKPLYFLYDTLWPVICSQPFSVLADLRVETWLESWVLSSEYLATWSLLCWNPVLILPQCSHKSLLDYLQVLIYGSMLSFNSY